MRRLIEKVAAGYESEKEGLGLTFIDRVAEAVDGIAQNLWAIGSI